MDNGDNQMPPPLRYVAIPKHFDGVRREKVEAIVDFKCQNDQRLYLVHWCNTWETEDRLKYFCLDLINSYWQKKQNDDLQTTPSAQESVENHPKTSSLPGEVLLDAEQEVANADDGVVSTDSAPETVLVSIEPCAGLDAVNSGAPVASSGDAKVNKSIVGSGKPKPRVEPSLVKTKLQKDVTTSSAPLVHYGPEKIIGDDSASANASKTTPPSRRNRRKSHPRQAVIDEAETDSASEGEVRSPSPAKKPSKEKKSTAKGRQRDRKKPPDGPAEKSSKGFSENFVYDIWSSDETETDDNPEAEDPDFVPPDGSADESTASAEEMSDGENDEDAKRELEQLTKRTAVVPRKTCEYCGRSFRFSHHCKLNPDPDQRIHGNKRLPVACEVCGTVHRKATCPNCAKKTCEECGSKYTQECKKCEYKCKECGIFCMKKSKLQSHIDVVHKKILKFECEVCAKKFAAKLYLKAHMEVHKQVKDYVCKDCGKAFKARNIYRRHCKIHTGVKPHHCDLCGKDFLQRIALKVHMRTHSDGPKRFQCLVCDKDFNHKVSLKDHMSRHHNEDERKAAVMIGLWMKYQHEGGMKQSAENKKEIVNRAMTAVALGTSKDGGTNNQPIQASTLHSDVMDPVSTVNPSTVNLAVMDLPHIDMEIEVARAYDLRQGVVAPRKASSSSVSSTSQLPSASVVSVASTSQPPCPVTSSSSMTSEAVIPSDRDSSSLPISLPETRITLAEATKVAHPVHNVLEKAMLLARVGSAPEFGVARTTFPGRLEASASSSFDLSSRPFPLSRLVPGTIDLSRTVPGTVPAGEQSVESNKTDGSLRSLDLSVSSGQPTPGSLFPIPPRGLASLPIPLDISLANSSSLQPLVHPRFFPHPPDYANSSDTWTHL